jgi:malate dehydrogenase
MALEVQRCLWLTLVPNSPNSLLRGLNGEKGVITPSFVKGPLFADQGIGFFSSNVELGVSAFYYLCIFFFPSSSFFTRSLTVLKKYIPSAEEKKLLDTCLPELASELCRIDYHHLE